MDMHACVSFLLFFRCVLSHARCRRLAACVFVGNLCYHGGQCFKPLRQNIFGGAVIFLSGSHFRLLAAEWPVRFARAHCSFPLRIFEELTLAVPRRVTGLCWSVAGLA
jgi:hypothetical protein